MKRIGLILFIFVLKIVIVDGNTEVAPVQSSSSQNIISSQTLEKEMLTNVQMQKIFSEYQELLPFIFDNKKNPLPLKNASAKKSKKVQSFETEKKHIKALKELFIELEKKNIVWKPGMQISLAHIVAEYGQIENFLDHGKYDEARVRLKTSLSLCMNCHSQSFDGKYAPQIKNPAKMPPLTPPTLVSIEELLKNDPFELAEYYYISRQFDLSLKSYEEFLQKLSLKEMKEDDERIMISFTRILNYFIRVKHDFLGAKIYFEKYLKQKQWKNFSKLVKGELSDWIKILSGKRLVAMEKFSPMSEDTMAEVLSRLEKDSEEGPLFSETNSTLVHDLELQAVLLNYINHSPEGKYRDQVYYWLADGENRLNDDLLFTLIPHYLSKCMEIALDAPTGKDCFEAYKDYWPNILRSVDPEKRNELKKIESEKILYFKNLITPKPKNSNSN